MRIKLVFSAEGDQHARVRREASSPELGVWLSKLTELAMAWVDRMRAPQGGHVGPVPPCGEPSPDGFLRCGGLRGHAGPHAAMVPGIGPRAWERGEWAPPPSTGEA